MATGWVLASQMDPMDPYGHSKVKKLYHSSTLSSRESICNPLFGQRTQKWPYDIVVKAKEGN
jgi:hypothetical protein